MKLLRVSKGKAVCCGLSPGNVTKKEKEAERLARIVIENSTPAGEIFGFKVRVSDMLPTGVALLAHPETLHDVVWVSFGK